MKKPGFIVLFAFLSLFSTQYCNAQVKEQGTIYKMGDFLVDSKDTMKVKLIVKSASAKTEAGDQDVLFEDDKYLMLGNSEKLGYYKPYGVYRKYRPRYKFSHFKVDVYKGRLAAPDFKTDASALLFRTQIKSQCKADGINFAGHFTITHWGCGSNCEAVAIVDRINGKIYYSDLIKELYDSFYTLKCRADSKMIIMNDWLLSNIHRGYIFCSDTWPLEIGTWNGSKLKFLFVTPLKHDVNAQ